MKNNFAAIAEVIAFIMEDDLSSAALCGELGQYVKNIIEETDLSHPDTVRRLLPIAMAIREENAAIQRDFQRRRRMLPN